MFGNVFSAKKIFILMILSLTLWLFAEHHHRMRGREVVQKGKIAKLKGELIYQNGDWFLKQDKKLIEMHFGPVEYQKHIGVKLEPTKDFECEGYIYKDSFAVSSFIYNKKKIVLRDDKGKALWEGTEFSHHNEEEEGKAEIKKDKHKKKKVYYVVNRKKCIGCRLCVANCPVNAIEMVHGRAVIDADKCIACGICADGNGSNYKGCPVDAISKSE